MKKLVIKLFIISLGMVGHQAANAKGINFDLLSSTPEGSWQVREDVDTNHKGKQTVNVTRTSMLGSEERNGEQHYWVEVALESFKVKKKGKRKKSGDRVIMKSLIPASTFSGDPANVMGNLRAFGVETIMQSGNEDPMRITEGAGMMAGVMAAMQTEIAYEFEQLEEETVTVPAGEFSATKIQGSGSVEMKIIIKKISVQSETTMWLNDKVPFGTVKMEGTSTTNGKQSVLTGELIEFGTSGAVSEITKEPKDLPKMPKLFN